MLEGGDEFATVLGGERGPPRSALRGVGGSGDVTRHDGHSQPTA